MIHLSLVQTFRARFGLVVAFGALAWSCGDRHGLSAEPERPRFEVVAQERQLFLDDQGVSEIHRLRRTMHPPRKRGRRRQRHAAAKMTIGVSIFVPKVAVKGRKVPQGSGSEKCTGLCTTGLPATITLVCKEHWD